MYNFYSYKKKRPTGLIITIIICSIIILTTGYFVYRTVSVPLPFKEKAVQDLNKEDIVTNNAQKTDTKYTKNTRYILTKNFICGHSVTEDLYIPPNFVGKTIDEIKKENQNIEITLYDDFSISATELYDTQCENHYIIKLKGNKLISYNKNEPDIIIKETTLNLMEFQKSDADILKNGIEVGSKEELLEFYEDFA